nr:DUF6682 family protein [Methylosinus sp. PW1]
MLQDEGSTRWPLAEMRLWFNDALREISLVKPTAFAKPVITLMGVGSYQKIDGQYTGILRITTNLKTVTESPRDPGLSIKTVDKDMLDAQTPYWQDQVKTRKARVVRNVAFDQNDPNAFWVYPPNDGTGVVDVIVSRVHPGVAEIVSPANPELLSNYSTPITDINDVYENIIVDYILYRSFSKDAQFAGSAARAAAYYSQFMNALNVSIANDANRNLNVKPAQENRA